MEAIFVIVWYLNVNCIEFKLWFYIIYFPFSTKIALKSQGFTFWFLKSNIRWIVCVFIYQYQRILYFLEDNRKAHNWNISEIENIEKCWTANYDYSFSHWYQFHNLTDHQRWKWEKNKCLIIQYNKVFFTKRFKQCLTSKDAMTGCWLDRTLVLK